MQADSKWTRHHSLCVPDRCQLVSTLSDRQFYANDLSSQDSEIVVLCMCVLHIHMLEYVDISNCRLWTSSFSANSSVCITHDSFAALGKLRRAILLHLSPLRATQCPQYQSLGRARAAGRQGSRLGSPRRC